jgi:hypothetical protein
MHKKPPNKVKVNGLPEFIFRYPYVSFQNLNDCSRLVKKKKEIKLTK